MTMDDAAERLLQRAYALTGDKGETRSLYADWAASYDTTMIGGLAYLSPGVIATATVERLRDPSAAILDVGCGTGLLGQALSEAGVSVVDGLDYSQPMLDQARAKGCYRDLYQVDLNQPLSLQSGPYGAIPYGAIVSSGTFTHGHVGPGCLPGLASLLAPSGIFILSIHKDLWHAEGFSACFDQLVTAGVLADVRAEPFKLFAGDDGDDGLRVFDSKTD